jgi:acetyl-CoA carboxylase biotin carboxyl carrier protein
MDLKKIKQIINLVADSGVHEVELEQDGFKIRVTGGLPVQQQMVQAYAPAPIPVQNTPAQQIASNTAQNEATEIPAKAPSTETGHIVKSPIVGTFYGSPSPGEPTFVKVGDQVQKGQTLCIIEAMKIMNEIESDKAGTITAIHATDSQPVEFDQPLFSID